MKRLREEMAVMVACRIASLLVGLLMIPLVLHFLRGEEFAAWALYLAIGMAFSTLDSASSDTLVRFVAPSAQEGSRDGISRIVTNMSAILLVAYVAFVPLILLGAAPLARLIHLPAGALVQAPALILLIYCAAMFRAFLLLAGQAVLLAGGNLRWFSFSSFAVTMAGNVTAVVAAGLVHHADALILASWAVQLALLGSYTVVSWQRYGWSLRVRDIDRSVIRGILAHGFQLQLKEWAHFFNYQFDKFLIAALSGLWGVGSYEVANRAVLSLRSVPVSGLGLLLPVASADLERGKSATDLYRETTRYAAFSALLFIGVPLAGGWYFVFAWAGETGYYARWAFPAIGIGALAAVTAIPAALLLQARGRPDVEARAAGISVLLNLPLSLLLIPRFGAAGAALAIGVATATGAIWILRAFHRMYGLSLRATVSDLWRTTGAPALAIACVAIASAVSFKVWFTPLLPLTGFSAGARMVPAMIAAAIGSAFALIVVLTARKRLGLGRFSVRQGEVEAAGAAADGSPGVVG